MGFVIHEDNTVELVRGNVFETTVAVKYSDSGEPYEFQAGDRLVFELKRNKMTLGNTEYVDTEPLVTKEIPTESCLLRLEPSDTEDLPFGHYDYEISLIPQSGDVDTFIKATDFMICKRVGENSVTSNV